ncbi:MAG: hypothetical protein KGJ13_11695, partial [Patescibacteria group bacterium]|nr:hypothetical protein [Patescibacteria group bacterium]
MPGQNLIQSVGGQPQKPTRFVSLFTSRFFNGLFTNRNLLRGPLGFLYTDFYHAGTTDVLCDGLNSELSTRLTIIRRSGNPKFSSANITAAADSFYSFHHPDGTIQVIVDTTSDVEVLTPSSKSIIWTKTAGAGESYFQGVAYSLYFGDGIDTIKYIPGTTNPTNQFGQGTNGSSWLFSPVAPTVAPTLTVTNSGSAGVAWAASTFFSTMGLLVDSNNNIQQLISVNALGTNTTQFGTSGNGQPAWNNSTGATTTDNTVTWTCAGPIKLWAANTSFTGGDIIFVPNVGGGPTYATPTGTGQGMTFPQTANGGLYSFYHSGQGFNGGTATTGSAVPKWTNTINSYCTDINGIRYQYIGPAEIWKPGRTYNSWWAHYPIVVCEPTLPTAALLAAGTQTVYAQTANNTTSHNANTPGVSGSGYTPPWSIVVGGTTVDNNL